MNVSDDILCVVKEYTIGYKTMNSSRQEIWVGDMVYKEGIYRKWLPSGDLSTLFNYRRGELDGRQLIWYLNGTLMYEYNYKNGKLHGLYKEFDNGELVLEINYLDGLKHGLERKMNGKLLVYEYTYRYGVLDGVQREYDLRGELFNEYYR